MRVQNRRNLHPGGRSLTDFDAWPGVYTRAPCPASNQRRGMTVGSQERTRPGQAQTSKQTNKQSSKLACKQTNKQSSKQACEQNKQTSKPTSKQTSKQARNKEKNRNMLAAAGTNIPAAFRSKILKGLELPSLNVELLLQSFEFEGVGLSGGGARLSGRTVSLAFSLRDASMQYAPATHDQSTASTRRTSSNSRVTIKASQESQAPNSHFQTQLLASSPLTSNPEPEAEPQTTP